MVDNLEIVTALKTQESAESVRVKIVSVKKLVQNTISPSASVCAARTAEKKTASVPVLIVKNSGLSVSVAHSADSRSVSVVLNVRNHRWRVSVLPAKTVERSRVSAVVLSVQSAVRQAAIVSVQTVLKEQISVSVQEHQVQKTSQTPRCQGRQRQWILQTWEF